LVSIDPLNVMRLVQRLDFPRVLGSCGESRAFDLLAEEMIKLGVPVGFEEFDAPWVEFNEAFIEIDGNRIPIEPLINPAFSSEWLPIPMIVEVKGELVEIPVGERNAKPCIALRRRFDHERPCIAGTLAQLFACPPQEDFVAYYLASDKVIPSGYVSGAYQELLSQSMGKECRFCWNSSEWRKTFRNMVVEIRGTELDDEAIIVGAHIDSWPGTVGASDNASGCAMLVEFARWFADHPPVRTVRFIWFTGEELDRRGSHAHMALHSEDSVRIRLYINVDSGFSIDHGEPRIAVTGGNELIGAIEDLLAETRKCVAVYESTPTHDDRVAFREHGIPTVWVCASLETPLPHPHLPSDRYSRLDISKLGSIGNLSLSIIDAAQRSHLWPTNN